MLHIQNIRTDKEGIIKSLAIKNFDAATLINRVLEVDAHKRELQKKYDTSQAEIKSISETIGKLFKTGKATEAEELKKKTADLKIATKSLSDALTNAEKDLEKLLIQIPNVPHKDVKPGKSSDDNEVLHSEGRIEGAEGLLPHWDITAKYNLIDFETGAKITGAGFPVYKGKGVKLQRALINFFLDKAIENGYTEVQPPLFVNEASAFATGQLPDKDGQMYHIASENFYLIPTAEVPVTNIYRDMLMAEADLPVKNVAYTPCFRREAGSYGKDVRGLNRLHQFDKVEIVQIQKPEKSYESLEEMRHYVCELLRLLELPFRVLRLCGGDISFTAALTYDMEVYAKGQKKWLEVSSVSNFEAFQSYRMKLRYRDSNKKTQLLHTLNGSALALPRIMAALIENNQTKHGVKIPECLLDYTGFEIIN